MKLGGKVAIVTGGAQGIGEGIVGCLAAAGADIAIVDHHEETASKVAGEVAALGRRSLVIEADVTDSPQVETAVQRVLETFGGIDILVNDVGGGVRARRREGGPPRDPYTFTDIHEDVWDGTFDLNAKSAFLMCREVVPYFIAQKSGKIVNLGSRLGRDPDPSLFVYSVTKATVSYFTKLLAAEVAVHNINVNCVCPGDVLTPGVARMFERASERDPANKGKTPEELFLEVAGPRTALGRLQTPGDMGEAVVFLVSEDARNITGQSLYVDGGQTMI